MPPADVERCPACGLALEDDATDLHRAFRFELHTGHPRGEARKTGMTQMGERQFPAGRTVTVTVTVEPALHGQAAGVVGQTAPWTVWEEEEEEANVGLAATAGMAGRVTGRRWSQWRAGRHGARDLLEGQGVETRKLSGPGVEVAAAHGPTLIAAVREGLTGRGGVRVIPVAVAIAGS